MNRINWFEQWREYQRNTRVANSVTAVWLLCGVLGFTFFAFFSAFSRFGQSAIFVFFYPRFASLVFRSTNQMKPTIRSFDRYARNLREISDIQRFRWTHWQNNHGKGSAGESKRSLRWNKTNTGQPRPELNEFEKINKMATKTMGGQHPRWKRRQMKHMWTCESLKNEIDIMTIYLGSEGGVLCHLAGVLEWNFASIMWLARKLRYFFYMTNDPSLGVIIFQGPWTLENHAGLQRQLV